MSYVPLRKKGNTRVTILGDDVIVTYHYTDIVIFNNKNKRTILNSGRWFTATTKQRMNQVSSEFGLGFNIFQKNFKWFVRLPSGNIFDFQDNMVI